VRLLARIHIKRTRRLHPEWTEAQLLEDVREWADQSGPYADSVTIEDVREVLVSMSDPRQEAMW
jgi:hypothetical protein